MLPTIEHEKNEPDVQDYSFDHRQRILLFAEFCYFSEFITAFYGRTMHFNVSSFSQLPIDDVFRRLFQDVQLFVYYAYVLLRLLLLRYFQQQLCVTFAIRPVLTSSLLRTNCR
jgi:hypothetical protein